MALGLIFTIVLIPASTPVYAAPSIELSPENGSPGADVRIDGSGFAPLSSVTITFDGDATPTNPGSVMTDVAGSFEASFEVPESSAGEYAVTATSQSIIASSSASSTFTIVATKSSQPDGTRPTEPTAYSQSVSTNEDEEKGIILQGSDDDGDAVTFKITNAPLHGVVKDFNPSTGSVKYQPNEDYIGTDSFTFIATSGGDESNPASVSIHITQVNDPPKLADKEINLDEDDKVTVTLTATDIDSSSVHFYLVDTPVHGKLSPVSLAGAYSIEVTYTPFENYYGTDVFKFRAMDKEKYSETAEVRVTVTPANDAPLAAGATVMTQQNQHVSVSLTASDIDADILTYVITSAPGHGILTGVAPNLEYMPSSNYHGYDSLSFKASDGIAESNIATVTMVIAETTIATESLTGVAAPVDPDITVQSRDTEPPRLIVPESPIRATTTSSWIGTPVTYSVSALDGRDGAIVPICSPASGHRFPVGRVNVVCTAQDSAGNTAMKSFVVEVELVGNSGNQSSTVLLITTIVAVIGGFAAFGMLRVAGRTGLLSYRTTSMYVNVNRISPFLFSCIYKVIDRIRLLLRNSS